MQYTFDGQYLRTIDLPLDPTEEDEFYWFPAGFDVLADGSLLVAQPNGGRILQLNPDGSVAIDFNLHGVHATDVSVYGADDFLVWSDGAANEYHLNLRDDDRFWIDDLRSAQLRDVTGEVFTTLEFVTRSNSHVKPAELLETSDGTIFGVGGWYYWKVPASPESGQIQLETCLSGTLG